MKRFINDILKYTPFLKIISLLVVLWLIFSAALFFSERGIDGTSITTYEHALYWTTAAYLPSVYIRVLPFLLTATISADVSLSMLELKKTGKVAMRLNE